VIAVRTPFRTVTVFQESTTSALGMQPHETGTGGGLIQRPAAYTVIASRKNERASEAKADARVDVVIAQSIAPPRKTSANGVNQTTPCTDHCGNNSCASTASMNESMLANFIKPSMSTTIPAIPSNEQAIPPSTRRAFTAIAPFESTGRHR